MKKVYSMDFAGRKLSVINRQLAQSTNGSALLKYEDTVLLTAVTASKNPKESVDFLPLSVSYEDRMYSKGRISSGLTPMDGKPKDFESLTASSIVRPLRPLFPSDFRNEVTLYHILMSADSNPSQPSVPAIIASSIALSISDIPFKEALGAIEIGFLKDQWIMNPTKEQKKQSHFSLFLCGTKDRILSVEAKANAVPESMILEAIQKGHDEIKKVVHFIDNFAKDIGKEKFSYPSVVVPPSIPKSEVRFGDMDFKVVGSKAGITSIQMNTKSHGLRMETIKKALELIKNGREHILDERILKTIPEPRKNISFQVPKRDFSHMKQSLAQIEQEPISPSLKMHSEKNETMRSF
jgi:polyribonucleotide nucleotidyltransferase